MEAIVYILTFLGAADAMRRSGKERIASGAGKRFPESFYQRKNGLTGKDGKEQRNLGKSGVLT
jgi:hypothetical protein